MRKVYSVILVGGLWHVDLRNVVDGDSSFSQDERRYQIVVHFGNVESVGEDKDVSLEGVGTFVEDCSIYKWDFQRREVG